MIKCSGMVCSCFALFSIFLFLKMSLPFCAIAQLSESVVSKTEIESEVHPIYCEADYLEYDREQGVVEGSGNVGIKYENIGIYSDHIKVNFKINEIMASGNISFISQSGKIMGDSITYNMTTKKGEVYNASTFSPPLYYRGKVINKISDDKIEVNKGLFTTCDLETPHYSLRAGRINIEIDKMVTASNITIYAGPIPVFYFPFLVFPLKEGAVSWFFPTIGHSQEKGIYVKAGYNYSPIPFLYGSIFFEYMQKKGMGVGSEYEYKSKKWGGASSLYYVRQGDANRYKINLKAQPSNSNSFFYTYFVNDTGFDREFGPYFSSPSNWVKKRWTTYISASCKLSRSPVNTKFDIKAEESKEGFILAFPKFKLYTYPFKIRSFPVHTDWSSSIGNYFFNRENYFLFNNNIGFTPESLKILPGLSLGSRLNLQGVYCSINGLTPGYKFTIGPRLCPNRNFLLLVSYNLDSEIDEDTYTSKHNPEQYVRILTSYTGKFVEYDLSGNYDLGDSSDFAERFKKMRFDISVNSPRGFNFFSSTKYNVLCPGTVQNVSYVRANKDNWAIQFGSQYSGFTAGTNVNTTPLFDLTGEVNATFKKYKFIFSTSYDLVEKKFRERDYIITRDLHCWEASIIYRELRPEIWFQFSIKAFPGIGARFHPKIF